MGRTVIIMFSLAWVQVDVAAQGVAVESGYVSGNQYRQFSESSSATYVMGVVDGFLAATLFDGSHSKAHWLKECIVTVQSGQLVAIVDKFLEEHPERWDEGMHVLVYASVVAACEARGFGKPPVPRGGNTEGSDRYGLAPAFRNRVEATLLPKGRRARARRGLYGAARSNGSAYYEITHHEWGAKSRLA